MTTPVRVPDLHPVVAVDHDGVKTWLIICGCGAHIATAGTLTEAVTRFGEHVRADTYNTAISVVRGIDGTVPRQPGSFSRLARWVHRDHGLAGLVGGPQNTAAATR